MSKKHQPNRPIGRPRFLPLPDVPTIQRRLEILFPPGLDNRNYFIREIAARTCFVMLYVGAIDGSDCWIRPDQVTRMTDAQSALSTEADRLAWISASLKKDRSEIGGRWYAKNTREPIRDETLRNALVKIGAVVRRSGIPVTSDRPTYALEARFAELLTWAVDGKSAIETEASDTFKAAAQAWRSDHATPEAMARITLAQMAAMGDDQVVIVQYPNGETRRLSYGPSSDIAKAVVEVFAKRYLHRPMVIVLSDSKVKKVIRDDNIANAIGFKIEAESLLPDVVIVDLGADKTARPLLVFVEIVASDGPVDQSRKEALSRLAELSGFSSDRLAFVTAVKDRGDAAFRRISSTLAWGSLAWCVSEPDKLINLLDLAKSSAKLDQILKPLP